MRCRDRDRNDNGIGPEARDGWCLAMAGVSSDAVDSTRHSGARLLARARIHNHMIRLFITAGAPSRLGNAPLWLWIPGSCFARPGMTEGVFHSVFTNS